MRWTNVFLSFVLSFLNLYLYSQVQLVSRKEETNFFFLLQFEFFRKYSILGSPEAQIPENHWILEMERTLLISERSSGIQPILSHAKSMPEMVISTFCTIHVLPTKLWILGFYLENKVLGWGIKEKRIK